MIWISAETDDDGAIVKLEIRSEQPLELAALSYLNVAVAKGYDLLVDGEELLVPSTRDEVWALCGWKMVQEVEDFLAGS